MEYPTITDEQIVFENRWIQIHERRVVFGTDHEGDDYYCVGKDQLGAVILAIDEDETVMLVRQYRPAVRAMTLDIPGGFVDAGESPADAARRELREETGIECARLELLATRYLDSGQKDHLQHIFVATGLTFGEQQPDEGEYVEVVRRPLDELYREVVAGEQLEPNLMLSVLLYMARMAEAQ